MCARLPVRVALALVAVLAAAGLVAAGRFTADTDEGGGQTAGAAYAAGLRAGEAEGIREGRALQAGESVPGGSRRGVRAAFEAGYAAGANDVFGGYDGGWALGVPYLVTLGRGAGPITYRIVSRTPLERGVRYGLCRTSSAVCRS